MPIAICSKCLLPCADSFHDFKKVCECIPIAEQKKRNKELGWICKFPPGVNE